MFDNFGSHCIIAGDFNTDLRSQHRQYDYSRNHLRTLIDNIEFHDAWDTIFPNVYKPIRTSCTHHTAIDYIFINAFLKDYLSSFDIFNVARHITDHKLLICQFTIPCSAPPTR